MIYQKLLHTFVSVTTTKTDMEIEIITTKKKLSKSIINQMPVITPKELEGIEFLGYLRNCRKGYSNVVLCKHNGVYCLINSYAHFHECGKYIWHYRLSGTECTKEQGLKFDKDFKKIKEGLKQIYI